MHVPRMDQLHLYLLEGFWRCMRSLPAIAHGDWARPISSHLLKSPLVVWLSCAAAAHWRCCADARHRTRGKRTLTWPRQATPNRDFNTMFVEFYRCSWIFFVLFIIAFSKLLLIMLCLKLLLSIYKSCVSFLTGDLVELTPSPASPTNGLWPKLPLNNLKIS